MARTPRSPIAGVIAASILAGAVAAAWTTFTGQSAVRASVARLAEQPAEPATAPERAASLWFAEDWAGAAAAYGELFAGDPANGTYAFRHAFALHASGAYEAAARAHEVAARFPRFRGVALYNLGCASALLGRPGAAFAALDRAIAAGFRDAGLMSEDADLASLRDDPRWDRLVAAVRELDRGHAMDFWVGSWEVRDGEGTVVGHNVITREQNGAVIREEWMDVNGLGGTSMNFFDWRSGLWRQVWVDGGGGIVDISGEARPDGSIVLEGERISGPNGARGTRTTFTVLPDGRVRQVIETTADEGLTWTVGFDGYYTRQDTGAEPPTVEAVEG